jgi:predicted RNA-binding Zn ribbon-like protein
VTDLDVLMALLETRPMDQVPEGLNYRGTMLRLDEGFSGTCAAEPFVSDIVPLRRLRDRLVPAVLGSDRVWARRELSRLAREYAITPAFDEAGVLRHMSGLDGFAAEAAARLVPAAMQLHAGGMIERVGSCRAPGCPGAFLDTSTRRQRKYCSAACSALVRMRRRREAGFQDSRPRENGHWVSGP